MKAGNIFESIPGNLDAESVDLITQNEKVKIQRIISKGHTSPATGWYDQDNDEWVLVIKGAAIIEFDGEAYTEISLGEGAYINIPAHKKHRVRWTDPETETVWLAVHY